MDYYFYGGGGPAPVAEQEIGREPVWNIFPLREVAPEAWETQEFDLSDATAPIFPFPQVPSADTSSPTEPTTESSTTDRATPAPTESPAP